MSRVEIVEVAPRDGLQNIAAIVPTADKVELVRRLARAGFRRIEVGSFVSPRHVPQMADIEAVVAEIGDLPGVSRMALVPNSRGARRALAAGIRHLEIVISMTDAHNMSNVRRPTADSIADLAGMAEEIAGCELRVGLATSFHCPFTGLVDEDAVIRTIERILKVRSRVEFAISDTTGMATPDHVSRLVRRALSAFSGGEVRWCFHGHDTAGFGIANVLAALEAGIRCFDGAAAGLGGCPFAPGATGNIATEDLAYLFARLGVATGIDLGRLLEASDFAADLAGTTPSGHARAIPRERLFGVPASP